MVHGRPRHGPGRGADYDPAIRLANVAGGLEVEKIGVATVTRDEILRDLLHGGAACASRHRRRCVARADWSRSWTAAAAVGQRVAFTNGCFDVLHAGHVQYLPRPRARRTCWSSASTATPACGRSKGPTRPVNAVRGAGAGPGRRWRRSIT